MKTRMGMGTLCAFPLLACAGTSGVSGLLSDTVTIHAGGHPRLAPAASVTYRASCKEASYSLAFDRSAKAVRFQAESDTDTPAPVDLSTSPLGHALLGNNLYGKLATACGQPGLYLFFLGYKVTPGGARPVSYTVIIDKGGNLDSDDGLHDEKEEYVLNKRME
ncbi:hypothetical protein HH212_14045 [Massilia forsythiae]|uniref:Lipoprotein n=1 Tax=Massilia forsythiae TaxID=2728020 RepID=A0A7Z2ZT56_9BURK|nr:hypothetical protein [Massilia forsythiae]QJE01014.1 hypothetical protein HH212_14045 [Massilia forsythiae]